MADEAAEQVARRDGVLELTRVEYRAGILAMSPEARAALAGIMRKQLDRIPAQFAKLREDEQALTGWLTEFAPEMLPPTGPQPRKDG